MDVIKYKYYIVFLFLLIIILYLYKTYGGNITEEFLGKKLELFDIPHFIEKKAKEGSSIISGVPLVIYESWHSNQVPEKMKANIYNLLDKNPEFDYYLYSDETCREFIVNNFTADVVNAFDILRPGAYKSDLWRYCILYKNGGVYLDIKYYSLVPLVDLIRTNPVIFVKDQKLGCSNGKYTGLYNAFMVSTPQNPIFKFCIDDILNSCKFKLYKNGALDITGPCLLGRIVIENNGYEYFENISFYHAYNMFLPIQILYNGSVILQGYSEYRSEQRKAQKTLHYSELWNQRQVYKNASIF
jgi:mannosyltransferase OCH1-like enzyme